MSTPTIIIIAIIQFLYSTFTQILNIQCYYTIIIVLLYTLGQLIPCTVTLLYAHFIGRLAKCTELWEGLLASA